MAHTDHRHLALISRALAHVDAHLDTPLSADILADRAAMSRYHFHRVFLAHVGCSVGHYVTWRRLQRACALLVSGREPVMDIALAVGFDSAQSLAKAMRRELDTSPTAVRRGDVAPWTDLLHPGRRSLLALFPHIHHTNTGARPMQVTRYAQLPAGLVALTATAHGMVGNTMERAARQAFAELMPAVVGAGLMARAGSGIAVCPDDPKGPDDTQCRYIAGMVFGYRMVDGSGQGEQPELPLSGSLAWWPLTPGRYAVFTHIGPYSTLHQTWSAIYRDGLPASGATLRDCPPLELMVTTPDTTSADKLHTEIWLPVAD